MKSQQKYSLQYIKPNSVCAEVGVWKGALSSWILKQQPAKLHLIDPWKTQDVIKRCYSIEQNKMDKIYNSKKKKPVSENSSKIFRRSIYAIKHIRKNEKFSMKVITCRLFQNFVVNFVEKFL